VTAGRGSKKTRVKKNRRVQKLAGVILPQNSVSHWRIKKTQEQRTGDGRQVGKKMADNNGKGGGLALNKKGVATQGKKNCMKEGKEPPDGTVRKKKPVGRRGHHHVAEGGPLKKIEKKKMVDDRKGLGKNQGRTTAWYTFPGNKAEWRK